MVLVGDDDGHQRFPLYLKGGMVNTVIHALLHLHRRNSHTLIVGHDGSGSGLKGIHLALGIFRGGVLMAPPVIQNLRDMMNLLLSRRLRTPENEIIILGAVKFLAESAHLL